MAEITDVLLKLFDTLKDQMKDVQNAINALLTNQNNIGNYIKTLPMDDVKQMLKDHAKESSSEIDSCTETVEMKTDTILEEVREIKGKIKTMVIIVLVVVSLFSAAILIGTLAKDTDPNHSHLEQKIEELSNRIDELKNKTP